MATKTLSENINQAISDLNGVKQALIDKGVAIPSGTKTSEYGAKIGEIEGGGGGLDISNVTDFYYFCYGNRFLDQIEKIKTNNGTGFYNMFRNCTELVTAPQLNTSNGTNFGYMFYGCTELTTVPKLDTSKGTSFTYMFYDCKKLTSIEQLNTDGCTDLSYTFRGCQKLTELPDINVSNVTSYSNAFYDCYELKKVPRIYNSAGKSIQLTSTFGGCKALAEIRIGNVGTGQLSNAFSGCTSLVTLEIGSFQTSNSMFAKCTSLENFIPTGTITHYSSSLDVSPCTKLTVESLVSILTAFKDRSGTTSAKIILGSANLAKLTAEQKQIAIDKNYTLA